MRRQHRPRRPRRTWATKTLCCIGGNGGCQKKDQQEDNRHMARNDDRYFYLREVGIEKGSYVLERFLKDLKDTSMQAAPNRLLIVRLGDYYREQDRQLAAAQARSASVESEATAMSLSEPMTPMKTTLASSRRGKGKGKKEPAPEEALTEDDFAQAYDDM